MDNRTFIKRFKTILYCCLFFSIGSILLSGTKNVHLVYPPWAILLFLGSLGMLIVVYFGERDLRRQVESNEMEFLKPPYTFDLSSVPLWSSITLLALLGALQNGWAGFFLFGGLASLLAIVIGSIIKTLEKEP